MDLNFDLRGFAEDCYWRQGRLKIFLKRGLIHRKHKIQDFADRWMLLKLQITRLVERHSKIQI